MAERTPTPQHSRLVHFVLPWVVAAAAFALFLATRNPWVSFLNLPAVAKVAGWDWMDSQLGPAVWLLTAPIRLLPEAARPGALNLLAALAAAGTLGLLAKCVALLPHDRTREQRQRERSDFAFLSLPLAWAPPVAAALFAGLQLTFWEHATAFTGEMVNLLLFAACVFCVLRARVEGPDGGERWWLLLAFLAPFTAAGNWGMLGFLPGFLVAAVWVRGLAFFEGRFLTRAMLCAFAGLLFYLFPPLVQKLRGNEAGLVQLLLVDLGIQKTVLASFPKYVVLIAGLTSLLPLLVMGIRWPSTFGDLNAAGAAVTNALFRLIHAAFLAACVWVAFDPPFTARALAFGVPFLPLYFLGALSLGYFAGYLLLLLGVAPQGRGAVKSAATAGTLGRLAAGVLAAALLAGGAYLGVRNLPALRVQNSAAAARLGDQLVAGLPAGAAVVLSDDFALRLLASASLARQRPGHGLLLLDTWLLPYHAYQRRLARRAGPDWPELALERLTEPLDDLTVVQQLAALAASNRLFYLHPSFGAYFEAFRLLPAGAAFELVRRQTNDPVLPRLPAGGLAAARPAWEAGRTEAAAVPAFAPGAPRVPDSAPLAAAHGRALNTWGVWLQRHGETAEAGRWFTQAAALDTNNVFAAVNRDFNARLAAPPATPPPVTLRGVTDLPPRFRDWRTVMAYSGPVDEPDHLFTLGAILSQGGLEHQALELYARVHELRPDAVEPALAFAGSLARTRRGPEALRLVEEIRRAPAGLTPALRERLSRVEAFAHLQAGDAASAERLLLEAAARPENGTDPLFSLINVYLQTDRLTNALAVAARLADAAPQDPRPAVTRSGIQIALGDFAGAVRVLTPVIERETNNIPALVNRALALNRLGRLDDAARDYQRLAELAPALPGVWFHLGELDFQRKDFPAARRHFQRFLEGVPPGTDEALKARARLGEMAGRSGG